MKRKTSVAGSKKPIPSKAQPFERLSEQWWATRKPEVQARRCTAHRSNGPRVRCKNPALVMQTVCRYHGGASARSKYAAQRRLGEALDRMARGLLSIAESAESETVRLAAIKEVLNLGGINGKTAIELEVAPSAPWLEILQGIAPVSRAESRAQRGVPDPPPLPTAGDDPEIHDAEIVDEPPARADERYRDKRTGPQRPTSRPDTSGGDTETWTGMAAVEEAARANRAAGVWGRPPGTRIR